MSNVIDLSKGVRGWLSNESVRKELAAAVGDMMDPDAWIAQIMIAMQDEKIKDCTDNSKFEAAHKVASMGLVHSANHFALVPYGNTVQVNVQWQGMKALMERHESVFEVTATLVHKSDKFERVGDEIHHDWDWFDPERKIETAADLRGGFLTVSYLDGRATRYYPVTVAYIEKCRGCAKAKTVWTAWYEQMATKTIFRWGYSRRVVPMDPLVADKLANVFAHEDEMLKNNPVRGSRVTPAKLGHKPQPKIVDEAPEPDGPTPEPELEHEQPPEPEHTDPIEELEKVLSSKRTEKTLKESLDIFERQHEDDEGLIEKARELAMPHFDRLERKS